MPHLADTSGVGESKVRGEVFYLGLGGRLHIGYPKQPTFSMYTLVQGEYEVQRFHESDRVISPTFPDLKLSVADIFAALQ